MKKLPLTLLLTMFLLIGFGQNEAKLLRKAYKKKDTTQLRQFFQGWEKDIPSISPEERAKLTDIQKETYQVFEAFYQPDRIDNMGGSEWGNELYANVEFLIIQNDIEIFSSDKISNPEEEREAYVLDLINEVVKDDSTRQQMLQRDENGQLKKEILDMFAPPSFMSDDGKRTRVGTITNFRPAIHSKNKQPLYLTETYSKILYKFLGKKSYPLGRRGLMNPASAKGRSATKQDFLENYIKIWQGHNGGYWLLHSYPIVSTITFDASMNMAKIDFRMVYEGGEAVLKKDNGTWKIISAYRTWIE